MFQIAHADAESWADLHHTADRDESPRPPFATRNRPIGRSIPWISLAVLVDAGIPAVYEHWFLVLAERNDHDAALEIFASPGVTASFQRWPTVGGVEGLPVDPRTPDDALDQAALLQRQDLLAQHPAYGKLSRQARQIREQILKMPLVATDQETAKEQSQRFGNWPPSAATRMRSLGNGFARRGRVWLSRRCGAPTTSKKRSPGDCDAGFLQCRREDGRVRSTKTSTPRGPLRIRGWRPSGVQGRSGKWDITTQTPAGRNDLGST